MKPRKIANICNTKFLEITLDNSLPWRTHINMIIPELSSACFAIRAVRPFLSQESMKIYYSYFHSIMMYGIIFWGNSFYSINTLDCKKILLESLWGLEITIPIYIITFTFCDSQLHSEIYGINTRTISNLHQPLPHLKTYQKEKLFQN